MSGHALMGRPSARLETLVLAFSSYVLVCILYKGDDCKEDYSMVAKINELKMSKSKVEQEQM